jgi:hypothetical protein
MFATAAAAMVTSRRPDAPNLINVLMLPPKKLLVATLFALTFSTSARQKCQKALRALWQILLASNRYSSSTAQNTAILFSRLRRFMLRHIGVWGALP